MHGPREDVTRWLVRLREADPRSRAQALQQVADLLYPELRRLAARMMRRERSGHTLQATALVHEAFLELVDGVDVEWASRAHFLGVAARVMRRVLVDHARRHRAAKRGSGLRRVTLSDDAIAAAGGRLEVLELDEALDRFAALDARGAQVVEMRVFGGLTAAEVATALGVSRRTVESDWSVARLWLARELRPARSDVESSGH